METLTTLITNIFESGILLELAIFILAITGNKKSAEELRQKKQAKLEKKSIKCVAKAKKYADKANKLEQEAKNAGNT